MADPATMMAVGTAAQVGQGVASGASGKRAAGQAQQRQDQFDQRVGGIVDQATEALFGQEGQGGILNELLGPGLGAGRDLFEQAGQAGQQYSGLMGDYQNMLLQPQGGFGFDFTAPGMTEGMEFINTAAGGMQGPMPGMDIAGQAAQGSLQGPQAYDFGAGQSLQQQTMDTFQQQAEAARATGIENVGQAFTGGQDALNAALASQGISPTSGVAASAIGEMAMQGAGQRAQFERDIAGAAGQTALQGAQFDVGAQLQREGMESGYGLGLQQLGLQGLGQAGSLGLGMAGQDLARLSGLGQLGVGQAGLGQQFALGREGLRSQFQLGSDAQQAQNIVNAANLARSGFVDPLAMQQDMFSQNIMNPFMAGAGGLQSLLGVGLTGMEQSLGRSERQAQAGGAGKGAAMGSAFDPRRSQQKGPASTPGEV